MSERRGPFPGGAVKHGGGDDVTVSGTRRIAAGSGEPLSKPIQQRGPYVL